MRKIISIICLTIMVIFCSSDFALSLNKPDASTSPVIVQEFVGQVDFVKGRVAQLADAMPQSTYEWRPMEGVRSVGEVYLHIAFANYMVVTLSGAKVPEDIGFVMDFSKAKDWETQTTDKTKIIEKMNESFDILKKRVSELTEEDLNRQINMFGQDMSFRNFMISMVAHCHEHLGQSIAYARSNNVTPPWSKQNEEGK